MGTHRKTLPFHALLNEANESDSLEDFPHSLLSVEKVADDNVVSVFRKHSVSAYKEEDWQPQAPTKRVRATLEQVNDVYDLTSIEQGIKWMHAVFGYDAKSVWLKAIKAGNFQGWLLFNEQNNNKYYPDTAKTPKGQVNQVRNNVRSTKFGHCLFHK
ncbi:hypothetical protein ACHAWF_008651 [Thalassiosira exigua]